MEKKKKEAVKKVNQYFSKKQRKEAERRSNWKNTVIQCSWLRRNNDTSRKVVNPLHPRLGKSSERREVV